jgi:hypothetical protein
MEVERQILVWSEESWRKTPRLPRVGWERRKRRKTGVVVATAQQLKILNHFVEIILYFGNNIIDRLQ